MKMNEYDSKRLRRIATTIGIVVITGGIVVMQGIACWAVWAL